MYAHNIFQRIINKILSLYVAVRYHRVPAELKYFIRDTYYCKLVQFRYILPDYLFKKRYKEISFKGEFGAELQFALPFAYWHYKNNTLKSTTSFKYTRSLYFFSPEHIESSDTRTNEGNYNFELPRVLYSHDYDMKKWLPVPLKEHYKNDIYIYDKPILIIANRYNMEWDGPPVSYLSIDTLDIIINTLKRKYTIVYNRPRAQNITTDNSEIYDLNEFDWLNEKHPYVLLLEDLFKENKANAKDFNQLQLMVYANADRFISIHGGTSVLASYFGGINTILSVKGPEHYFGCYQKLYPKLSGATIYHAKNEEDIKYYINKYY
jgi:hypothetical protein